MFKTHLKRLSQTLLLISSLCAGTWLKADTPISDSTAPLAKDKITGGGDSNHFAPVPFEYASLTRPSVKPNLIFLIDNSSFSLPIQPQTIVGNIVQDPQVIKRARVGIAYVYADTHPFFTWYINPKFWSCVIANIGGGGGAGIPACLPLLADQTQDILINSHKGTLEVKLNDLFANLVEVEASLVGSALNNSLLPSGLPVVTRRYYEITREIRGLPPQHSFLDRPQDANASDTAASALAPILNGLDNPVVEALINLVPGIGPLLKGLIALGKDIMHLVGKVPAYEPLFQDAMLYRCQPNIVVVLSPSVVSNAAIAPKTSKALEDLIQQLSKNLPVDPVTGQTIDILHYIPKSDLNPLTIPEDDTLVRNYIYRKGNKTLTFDAWNAQTEQYGDNGLAFLSTLFNQTDLKTNGIDGDGQSWDSTDFPLQNITTITVNTTAVPLMHPLGLPVWLLLVGFPPLPTVNDPYLSVAASPLWIAGIPIAYFRGMDGNNAIKQAVINKIMAVSTQGFSPTSSTVLYKVDPFNGISAYLNTSKWSSSLRLYPLKKKHEEEYDYTAEANDWVTPSFGLQKVIVSDGLKAPYFLKADTALNTWIMRPRDISDKQINEKFHSNLRDRCAGETSGNCADRMMGDIINTPIYAIDIDEHRDRYNNPYPQFIVTAANDGMVHIFKRNNSTNPYTLALDFIPGAAKRSGNATVWDYLPARAEATYGTHKLNPHQYLINGGLSYMGSTFKECNGSSTCISSRSQLFAVGSYGQGARGLYAFNIGGKKFGSHELIAVSKNSPDAWLEEVPLWESGSDKYGINIKESADQTKKAHHSLGFITGTPILAKVSINRERNNELDQMKPKNGGDTRYAVFTGDGYFSEDREPTLYVFDVLGISTYATTTSSGAQKFSFQQNDKNKGKLIAKISVQSDCGCKGIANRQSLSPPAVVDIDGDEIADIVYAGDYRGNLYRFDLRKADPSQWKATKIFAAGQLDRQGYPSQPITTAPVVYRLNETGSQYVVMFGTGSDIFQDDLTAGDYRLNTSQQTLYGIYDDLNKDGEQLTPVTRADLLKQTMTVRSGNFKGETRQVVMMSDQHMTPSYKGWYIDLTNAPGERIVQQGKVTGHSAFFTTRVYSGRLGPGIIYAKACSNPVTAGSYGYLLGINPRTGGRLKRSMVNLNKLIDQYDKSKSKDFISGFKLAGVPSQLSYSIVGQTSVTNRSGQFKSGWENLDLKTYIKDKHYDEGHLFLTSNKGEYYVISAIQPNYIRVKKLNSRIVF